MEIINILFLIIMARLPGSAIVNILLKAAAGKGLFILLSLVLPVPWPLPGHNRNILLQHQGSLYTA